MKRRTWVFLTIASMTSATVSAEVLWGFDSWFLLTPAGRASVGTLFALLVLQTGITFLGVSRFRSFRYQQLVVGLLISMGAGALGVADQQEHALYRVFCNVSLDEAACGAASRTASTARDEARYAIRACTQSFVGHGLVCSDWRDEPMSDAPRLAFTRMACLDGDEETCESRPLGIELGGGPATKGSAACAGGNPHACMEMHSALERQEPARAMRYAAQACENSGGALGCVEVLHSGYPEERPRVCLQVREHCALGDSSRCDVLIRKCEASLQPLE